MILYFHLSLLIKITKIYSFIVLMQHWISNTIRCLVNFNCYKHKLLFLRIFFYSELSLYKCGGPSVKAQLLVLYPWGHELWVIPVLYSTLGWFPRFLLAAGDSRAFQWCASGTFTGYNMQKRIIIILWCPRTSRNCWLK